MHATYLFLVSDGDPEEEDAERWGVWEGQVEHYLEKYGDENNWYTLLGGVHRDGQKHVYDKESPHFLSDEEATFDSAMLLSMRCIGSEIQLGGVSPVSIPGQEPTSEANRLLSLTYEEYKTEVISKAFAVLGWEYSQLSRETWEQIKKRDRFSSDGETMGMYLIATIGKCMIHFLNCAIPPFTRSRCTPYDYRCLDLRNEDYDSTDLTNCAILYVDIHT